MDETYMKITEIIAQRSRCRRAQVGALLVRNGNIIAFGWNGTPSGFPNECEDGGLTRPSVIHAEQNALAKAARSTISSEGATIYCTHAPCVYCAKSIIQSGIARVVYRDEYHSDGLQLIAEAGITIDRQRT